MLDCILIDDEPSDPCRLERLLAAHADSLRIVGRYRCGNDALAMLDECRAHGRPLPAVAFVDMQVSGLSGLEVAARLRQSSAGIAIVFVTAHREYAAEAFDEEAIDLLLKPVDPERLAQTVGRLQRYCAPPAAAPAIQIRSFGGFTVTGPAGEVRWHSARTREIFAYLLHHRHASFTQERLLEDIYAECDHEHARRRYYDDLYRLRSKLVDAGIDPGVLRIEQHRLYFDPDAVAIDVDRFEHLLAHGADAADEAEALRQALQLAAGAYCHGHDWSWALARREQLDARRHHVLSRLADLDLVAGRHDFAEAGLLQLLDVAPYDEPAIVRLIQLYRDTGRSVQAHRAYERYRQRLQDDLQVEPGARLQALFAEPEPAPESPDDGTASAIAPALIIEDHPLFGMALLHLVRSVLGGEPRLVADAEAGLAALAEKPAWGLIVMDLGLPGQLQGSAAVAAIRAAAGGIPLLVVSAAEEPEAIAAALAAGASAYVSKRSSNAELADALRRVLADAPSANVPRLAADQREILRLLCAGLSNTEIAERLDIPAAGIKTHIASVLRALGVATRTQAVLAARQAGLG